MSKEHRPDLPHDLAITEGLDEADQGAAPEPDAEDTAPDTPGIESLGAST